MTSYERLERWLAAHRPQILANLQPPASDADLAALAETLGVSLPPSFLDLYRWKNGQRDPGEPGPFYGLSFLSIPDLLKEWENWNEILADNSFDLHGFSSSVAPGVVKERYANRHWIPFSHDWGGNHIGVDLDPGPKGRVGQVINFGRDEDAKYVLGQTVQAFVARLADELEAGNFVLMDPPDVGFETKTPPSSHFLDAARVWFGS
ncbi:MAG TPA: SMI1/KNR4 family protein [Longimicrobium sp.]|nr:SMI1/KNR4 family protein [Longimicrobium sp.]